MARNVTVVILGGQPKVVNDVETVRDVKEMFNVPSHTATIDGRSASDSEGLNDYSFVNLAPAVKGN